METLNLKKYSSIAILQSAIKKYYSSIANLQSAIARNRVNQSIRELRAACLEAWLCHACGPAGCCLLRLPRGTEMLACACRRCCRHRVARPLGSAATVCALRRGAVEVRRDRGAAYDGVKPWRSGGREYWRATEPRKMATGS
jgi:hypothetical protein